MAVLDIFCCPLNIYALENEDDGTVIYSMK